MVIEVGLSAAVPGDMLGEGLVPGRHDKQATWPADLRVEGASLGSCQPTPFSRLRNALVHVTGLPVDESVSALADGFGTALFFPDGSGSSGGDANVLLTPQGGQPQEPGFIVPIGADTVPLDRMQPVGQSGTVELELLFFGPLYATKDSNTGTLTFDSIQFAGQTQPIASGPWVFPIPISARPLK